MLLATVCVTENHEIEERGSKAFYVIMLHIDYFGIPIYPDHKKKVWT